MHRRSARYWDDDRVEFVKDRESRKQAAGLRDRIVDIAFENDCCSWVAQERDSRFTALCTTIAEIDEALETLKPQSNSRKRNHRGAGRSPLSLRTEHALT
jgi:hypothetical protein